MFSNFYHISNITYIFTSNFSKINCLAIRESKYQFIISYSCVCNSNTILAILVIVLAIICVRSVVGEQQRAAHQQEQRDGRNE